MNTQLQKLFEKYDLEQKDKFEINQIFELLPSDKKQNILNNFDVLVFNLEEQRKERSMEQEILLGDLYKDLNKFVEEERKKIVLG